MSRLPTAPTMPHMAETSLRPVHADELSPGRKTGWSGSLQADSGAIVLGNVQRIWALPEVQAPKQSGFSSRPLRELSPLGAGILQRFDSVPDGRGPRLPIE